eukprot:gene1736-1764_t
MNRAVTLALLAVASLPLGACVGEYGYGARVGYASAPYEAGPYAYDGWYDGYYGQVYDGYWGDDGAFYYRHGNGDRAYLRGDGGHFARQAPQGPHNYQPLHGTMTPGQGARMPHFQNRGNGGGRGREGGGNRGDNRGNGQH